MIDWLLAILLILVLPGFAIWRSLHPRAKPASRMRRYWNSIAYVVVLLLLLATSWWSAGRTLPQLGLGWPFTRGAAIGLIVFVALLAILSTISHLKTRKLTPAAKDKLKAKAPGSDMLPQNPHELAVFLLLAVLLGCGWELLYRGFLWWFLAPRVGTVGAICIAALAYGLGHGVKERKQAIGSIVSAFAFMVAFVLTHSLWWLMLIHTALPLAGGLSAWRGWHRSDDTVPNAEA